MIGWYKFWEPFTNCNGADIFLSFRSFWIQIYENELQKIAIKQNVKNTEDKKYHFCFMNRINTTRSWPNYKEFFKNFTETFMNKSEYVKIFENVAPSTLRIPISLVRWEAM